jgi:hypothetical protein
VTPDSKLGIVVKARRNGWARDRSFFPRAEHAHPDRTWRERWLAMKSIRVAEGIAAREMTSNALRPQGE